MTQTKAELLQTRHQGDIRLGDADSSHYVGFKAPATVGTSLVWTLPAADGTANYLLKTDGSGNLGWVADSSTDSTKMPLAGGIFTGDVTFDGATAGRDIVFDRSDNALEFADNAKAVFGTGGDLELYFDDTNSYLYHKTGTTLILKSDGGISLKTATNEDAIACNLNGSVQLYYDNVETLRTHANGISVRGPEGGAGQINLYSDEGDDNADLWRLTKEAGNSSFRIQNYTSGSWETNILATGNGAVELYYDNSKILETLANGIAVAGKVDITNGHLYLDDNYAARFGTGEDLLIYHDGTDSKIVDTGTGMLRIGGDNTTSIENAALNEYKAKFITNGAVELYHDNVKKFETQASGIDVTGSVGCDKIVIDGPYQQVAEALGALDVNCGNGNYFTKTINANSTFAFSNVPGSGTSFAFTLELTHTSGTVTWPSSVKWNADTAPTLTTGKTHLFMFVTDDGGTRWRGSALVDYVN
jgi:hypothetical protein